MDLPALKRTIFSHYFYNGIAVATGVIGIGLLTNWLFDYAWAAAAATGAVAVSIVDTPSPVRHKFSELLASVLLTTITGIITALCKDEPAQMGAAILVISFTASMLTAYGKKAMPLSFSMMFMMVLTMATPLHGSEAALEHSLIACLGGLVYSAYALAVAALLWYRTKQQALAECLYEFARYLDIKSRFFDTEVDLDENYAAIIAQQTVITDRLQTARDFVLRNLRTDTDGRLAATLFATVDLYEYILSSQTDYVVLRKHYGGSDVLMFLRDLIRKGQRDIERVSWAITRNMAPGQVVNFKAELYAIKHELWRLGVDAEASPDPEQRQALEILNGTFRRVRISVEHIEQMHTIAITPVPPGQLLGGLDLKPFLSHPSYSVRVLGSHLSFDSPILRHAVRMTLAMGCGYLLALHLPYATHGHWILLTIAVIMRANFSLAKQRSFDRVIGNLIGCVLTAVLLNFVHLTPVILLAVFIAMAIAHTFVTINYRFTAAATCVMGLLQLHLLANGGPFLITERNADTFIGAGIAYLFSFVLPHWEYRGIPRLVLGLLKANLAYARAALTHPIREMEYRIGRKQLHDAISALSSAVRRMIAEPASRSRSVAELNSFLALNYLLASQLAAIRVLLQRRAAELDLVRAAVLMELTWQQLERSFSKAEDDIESLTMGPISHASATTIMDQPAAAENVVSVSDSDAQHLLEQRLEIVRTHVKEIRGLAGAIAYGWQPIPAARTSAEDAASVQT